MVPSEDVARVFPPVPTAIHRLFLNVIQFASDVNVVAPLPVHVLPLFVLVAKVFVPEPTAIQRPFP